MTSPGKCRAAAAYHWSIEVETEARNEVAPRGPRIAVITWSLAGAAVLVFLILTIMVWHTTGPQRWERPIMSAARRHAPPGMNTWRSLFDPAPFRLITTLIAGAAVVEKRPRLALAGIAGCVIATMSAEYVLKPIIERRQVFRWYPWYNPESHLGSLTFPSGHVAAAAACATFAWFVLRPRTQLAVLTAVVPLLVAWSMIALRQHYPADTVAGFVLGPLVVCACVALTVRVFGPDDPAAMSRWWSEPV